MVALVFREAYLVSDNSLVGQIMLDHVVSFLVELSMFERLRHIIAPSEWAMSVDNKLIVLFGQCD